MRIDWTLQRTSGPTTLPLPLADLKRRLNLPVDYDHHDSKLTDLLSAATEQFESDTDRICMEQTFAMQFARFANDWIDLKKRPIARVDSITYIDAAGAVQTISADVYRLSQARRQVLLNLNQDWPTPADMQDAITVTYAAGVPDPKQVPALYVQAITMLVGNWFADPADQAARDPFKTSYDRLIRKLQQEQDV